MSDMSPAKMLDWISPFSINLACISLLPVLMRKYSAPALKTEENTLLSRPPVNDAAIGSRSSLRAIYKGVRVTPARSRSAAAPPSLKNPGSARLAPSKLCTTSSAGMPSAAVPLVSTTMWRSPLSSGLFGSGSW